MVYLIGSCGYNPVLNWSQLFRLEKAEKVEKQKVQYCTNLEVHLNSTYHFIEN